jgi:hypothetical protein
MGTRVAVRPTHRHGGWDCRLRTAYRRWWS